jgi:PAS domain S-box-containing protein
MPELKHLDTDPILDSIADGVFTVDKQWNVTSFNRAAEHITGVMRKDAIGRKCWEVFRADVCEGACVLKKTMATGKTIVNRTVHIIDSKGRNKPISVSTALLKDRLDKITGGVETFRDLSEIEELRKELLGKQTFHDFVTADHRIIKMFDTLPAIAQSDGTVLVLGDSGTGKELLARAIHALSNRSAGPFIAVNCGALPDNLLESELFGYKKGAFTDAKTDKPGRFELARGGTIFLDEIGDVSKAMQVKLLRVLQEKTFEPLGATKSVTADARIITATNRDLDSLVKEGTFRKDLFYRINMMPVHIPPLAQRPTDIPLLADYFLARLNVRYHRNISGFSDGVTAALMRYEWPGNVRELENVIHHAFILSPDNLITKEALPENIISPKNVSEPDAAAQTVSDFEARKIKKALEDNRFNKKITAESLGMNTSTLWRKMKKYGIS